ncbi:hypothetical protein [Microbacterium arborescens]|jgi:hypothetical protein|uniref:hypothetical protein n=1 Tax=Microbacterium TaxID=33882 RepID=UPI0025A1EA88|nr:hypothetical protein [Microbacterium arborescens]MDF2579261.1 hypothetical protein [Microbacterium sp.]WJM15481.1 hypothetical protein QUC20_14565 [Microbacterium arborescens]
MTTTSTTPQASTASSGVRWGRVAVLALAIGQPVSSLAFELWSPTELQGGADFSPIVPPGPMFSIWGVIISASILWALLQARRSTADSPVRDRLVAPNVLLYAGFFLWLTAAAFGQQSAITLLPFLLIVGANLAAWARISHGRDEIAGWKPLDRVTLYASQGLYAGWTSMAFFVNVATVLQGSGAPNDGGWGTTWQILVIAAAAGLAVVFLVISRGSIWYAATAAYALVGATISSVAAGYASLPIALISGIALIAVTTTVIRRRVRAHAG